MQCTYTPGEGAPDVVSAVVTAGGRAWMPAGVAAPQSVFVRRELAALASAAARGTVGTTAAAGASAVDAAAEIASLPPHIGGPSCLGHSGSLTRDVVGQPPMVESLPPISHYLLTNSRG